MFGLNEKAIGPGGGSYAAPREYWWGWGARRRSRPAERRSRLLCASAPPIATELGCFNLAVIP